MPLIDSHVHWYPPEVGRDPGAWAEAQGESHWATLCTRRRRDGRPVQTLPTLEQLLREMDAAGVDRAVLLGWYWEKPETCGWQNRAYAAAVRAHPDRLAAFATVHPGSGRESTIEEIRRARGDGLIGLGELSPHAQGYAVDDPAFSAALEMAGDLGLPVNLHVTDPASRPFPGRVETPAGDFLRLARAFPATIFVLAHWGGLLPLREADALAMTNVFYDTAASPLLYDAGIWQRFLAAVPAERILFGSDFPLNLYPKLDELPAMGRFISEARSAGVERALMGGNAARLLKL